MSALPRKIVIGVTGSIASGKSVASKYLEELGYQIIDTDIISHQVVEPNTKGFKMLVSEFGEDIVKDGMINRKLLGYKVFNNELLRKKLNKIMHPIILEETMDQITMSDHEIIFLVVPLLFESNFHKLCQYTLSIVADDEHQLVRLINRDKIDVDLALKKIASQMPVAQKKMLSDFIIENNGTENDLKVEIDKFIGVLKVRNIII